MPKYEAKVIDGETWIKLADHKEDIKRYKDVIDKQDIKIAMLSGGKKSAVDQAMDSIFSGLGKKEKT